MLKNSPTHNTKCCLLSISYIHQTKSECTVKYNSINIIISQGLLLLEFNSKMKLGDQLKNFRTIKNIGGFITLIAS